MRSILLRFGELYLKGNNRYLFEKMLIDNIKYTLKDEKFQFEKTFGRYVITNYNQVDENRIIEKLKRVFGLHSFSITTEVDSNKEDITNEVCKIDTSNKSFKVFVKRADKTFEMSSMEFASYLGEKLLEKYPASKVDLYKPEISINVDMRINGKSYIFTDSIKGQGGLPLGCSGKGLMLLSGGIDSPVAGYLIAKRGMKLDALHFHSYPYTSEQAKDKVITLAKELSQYLGHFNLHIVSFTKVQEEIHKHCLPEYMITIMRRIMMRVAEKICENNKLGAIVTGESLGQVASQTMESMQTTGSVLKSLPILRPCVAMDKEDIIKVANEIETFKTSILPYEDCCTVFLPKNPVIRPTIEKCLKEESKLDISSLVDECVSGEEIIKI